MKELLQDLVKVQTNGINCFPFMHFMSVLMAQYKTNSAFPALTAEKKISLLKLNINSLLMY